MTGPEHYREAELLIEGLGQRYTSPMMGTEADHHLGVIQATLAQAQVHATLALAAATALAGRYGDVGRWAEVAGSEATP